MKAFIGRNPAISYFVACFAVSWLGAFALIGPKLLRGLPLQKLDGLLMFPVLIIGPAFSGISLSYIVWGKPGVRRLFSAMGRFKVRAQWYLPLLIPPATIFAVLSGLKLFVSVDFTPQFFPLGVLFALPAGILEETGWAGFAFPALRQKFSAFKAGVLLGVIWGLWHLPVVDFLGAASPHGSYWLPFVCAFIGVLSAMRVLIAWIFCNTNSVLLCQLMHISSTGFLVIFGPPRVSAAQEALWYGVYAVALWIIALVVRRVYGKNLSRG
jgi:membrane protease YdiL (CAAX protease family)